MQRNGYSFEPTREEVVAGQRALAAALRGIAAGGIGRFTPGREN